MENQINNKCTETDNKKIWINELSGIAVGTAVFLKTKKSNNIKKLLKPMLYGLLSGGATKMAMNFVINKPEKLDCELYITK